jgi:hypothetical protein
MQRDPLKYTARYLAYSWYRLRHLNASHAEAWKFSGLYWKAFLLQALEKRRKARRKTRAPAVAS